jgi:hypothetical protein
LIVEQSRRGFLLGLVPVALLFVSRAVAQRPQISSLQLPPLVPNPGDQGRSNPDQKHIPRSPKTAREQIRENVDRLYQLAKGLKAEAEKTDSSEVLSLGLIRKAEEIEKLAKEIKALATSA